MDADDVFGLAGGATAEAVSAWLAGDGEPPPDLDDPAVEDLASALGNLADAGLDPSVVEVRPVEVRPVEVRPGGEPPLS